MNCEKCNSGTMQRKLVNYVPVSGYSTIVEMTCSACDYSYKQVA